MLNPHRTFILLKPDGYKRRLLTQILFQLRDLISVVDIYCAQLSRPDVVELYGQYRHEPFYKPLVRFMLSGPCIMMEVVGNHAVSRVRKRIGTGEFPFPAGTIRSEFATSTRKNVVHCSDSSGAANKELTWFFGAGGRVGEFSVREEPL